MSDPYVYPGPGRPVLRNVAGLRDADTLAHYEAQASTLRLAQLAARGLEGAYDLPHLREFHRFIFQDVYPWAGELRSVRLAKADSLFALPEFIENYTKDVLQALSAERHLRGLSRERFAERLTHYYAEINAIHPFREGNGRAQRAFLRQLALEAGHTLSWEHLDAEELIHASRRSFQGDSGPMRAMIEKVLDLPNQ